MLLSASPSNILQKDVQMSELRMLRNSERSALKRCPTRWYWGYEEGLKPNKVNTKLWMGTGVHLALAEWYQLGSKRGPHPVATWEDYCADEGAQRASAVWDDEEVTWYDTVEMGKYMLNSYVDHYGTDVTWDVIATEQVFNLIITDAMLRAEKKKAAPARELANLVGTFDGVYRDKRTKELWLMEHKTAAGISFKHLPLDPQGATYHAAATEVLRKAGLIGPKEEIVGVMYNFLLKYMPPADDRPIDEQGNYRNKPKKVHFVEALGEAACKGLTLEQMQIRADKLKITVYGDISARQPKPIDQMFHREPLYKTKQERINQKRHIVNDALTRQMYINGELPLIKNPTRDCFWDCDFYQLCQLHEQGSDWEEYRDLAFHKEDPYADHERKSA